MAAVEDLAFVSSRDLLDQRDVFQAIDMATGKVRWQVRQSCQGDMDYGRGPRATPVVLEDRVILLGAFGHLHCVNRTSGQVLWKKDLVKEYEAPLPTWGFCGSPLVVGEKLILQTGATGASLVALNLTDGTEIWRSGNENLAYSSLVLADSNGVPQVIGYDERSIGGWSIETGQRLWTISPPETGDFNVATPIVRGKWMWLISENNGLRLYEFINGIPNSEPVKTNLDLLPDTHTPILIGDRLFVVYNGLHCLDAQTLQPIWTKKDEVYSGHASIIASETRLLTLSQFGDLTLVDARANEYRELGRVSLGKGIDFQSHPAWVNERLVVRVGKSVSCFKIPAAVIE